MALNISSIIPAASEIHPVTIAAKNAVTSIAKLFVEQDESAKISAMAFGDSQPIGLRDDSSSLAIALHAGGDARTVRNFDTHATEVKTAIRELHNILTENEISKKDISSVEHLVVDEAATIANAQLDAGVKR